MEPEDDLAPSPLAPLLPPQLLLSTSGRQPVVCGSMVVRKVGDRWLEPGAVLEAH